MPSLDSLRTDPRLARVTGEAPERACVLQLWLMDTQDGTAETTRVLFGWVIPSTFSDPKRWHSFNAKARTKIGEGEQALHYRIRKLTYRGDGQAIFTFLARLAEGDELADVCRAASMPDPPAFCVDLRLASSDKLASRFTVRPPVFLETRGTFDRMRSALHPIASPIVDASAFMGALYRLDKESLWEGDAIDAKSRTRWVTELHRFMAEETGLNFRGPDAARFGNIEWIAPSAVDAHDFPLIEFESNAPCTVTVTIRPGLPPGTPLLVRCRLRNDREIVLDRCRETAASDQPVVETFIAQEAISDVHVTVWRRDRSGSDWEICHEHAGAYIREIAVNLSVNRLSANLETPRLTVLAQADQRVRKSHAINQQTPHSSDVVGNYSDDRWVPVSRAARELAGRLFPPLSEGGFFPNGWDGARHGFVGFIDWFGKLSRIHDKHTLLLMDPYFDEDGIFDLFANARSTENRYVVLTSTLLPSDDDQTVPPEGSGKIVSRADRLVAACRKTRMILAGLDFKIMNVRPVSGQGDQLFHDRYLLISDDKGEVRKGFHLSNSIQGASRNYPLLVTPIPADLLGLVASHVSGLMKEVDRASGEKQLRVETLVDSADLRQRPSAAALDEGTICRRLLEHGLVRGEGTFRTDEGAPALGETMASALEGMPPDRFGAAWDAVGDWLSVVYPDYEPVCLRVFGAPVRPVLVDRLAVYLSDLESGKTDVEAGDAYLLQQHASAMGFLREEYPDLVLEAWKQVNRIDPAIGRGNWGSYYGARILACGHPARLASVISGLRSHALSASESPENVPGKVVLARRFRTILQALKESIVFGEPSKMADAFLRSDVPFLRALATHMVFTGLAPDTLRADLPPSDYLHALAGWINVIRSKGDQDGGEEDPKLPDQRKAILAAMVESWSQEGRLDEGELKSLVAKMSGPAGNGGAVAAKNDLLLPLVDAGKLSLDRVAAFWMGELARRLREQLNGESNPTLRSPGYDELNELSGWALAICSPEQCSVFLKLMREIVRDGNRSIRKPFSRSLDFPAWDGAVRALSRMLAVIQVAEGHHEGTVVAELSDLGGLRKELEALREDLSHGQ
jgi:hypothetical protein